MIYNNSRIHYFLFLLFIFYSANADELVIDGDIKTLLNAESRYNINLVGDTVIPYLYKFIIDIPELAINMEEFRRVRNIEWQYNFTGISPGSYQFIIQAYVYPFLNTIYGWKVAETIVTLEIRNSLDDFISINTKQDVPDLTTDYVFIINKTVNFSANIDPQSILRRISTKLDYLWTINGPYVNKTKLRSKNFEFIFNSTSEYTVNLQVTAVIQPNQLKESGERTLNIQIKTPISNVTILGNTFVENESLLHLNVVCNGSSKFLICHDFSSVKSNNLCFNSGKVLSDCNYMVTHYFPENGTKYVNIGIRNDVSIVSRNIKITIYKVGPKPSFAFVIIPLISLMLVIIIVVAGITHYIKQRRKMNATIEVATIENFGFYNDDNETLLEKTFCRRVKDSFGEALHCK